RVALWGGSRCRPAAVFSPNDAARRVKLFFCHHYYQNIREMRRLVFVLAIPAFRPTAKQQVNDIV
ncbi:MAG: hypothetical protein Q4G41_01830, partial [Coriobacteriales bacterium]|nr:hypothetical protein [Coriobacteriales bacterium]